MKRSIHVALTGLALGTGEAAAQAYEPALSCEVADFSMTLRLFMPLSPDGTGSPGAAGMQGTVELHHQKVPKDRRLWSLDGKRPAQFWNRDRQLKILLVLGPASDPISLVIDTVQRDMTGDHRGEFFLMFGGTRLTGKLACVVG